MIKISVSEKALRLLRMLQNWRQNGTLDELVSQLAKEELSPNNYSSLGVGSPNVDRSYVTEPEVDPQHPPAKIVSDWIFETDSSNNDGNKSSSITKLTEPDGEYYDLIGGCPEDFFFTKIISVKINSIPYKELTWIGLIRSMLAAVKQLGFKHISSRHGCWVDGRKTKDGWKHFRELNMSIHRTDAYRSGKQIADLALRYKIPVEVKITWKKKGKYPFCKGLLRIDPRN